MTQAKQDMAKACDYCGRTGLLKGRATSTGGTRLYCHTATLSCYNACRGRYFEDCTCDKVSDKAIYEQYERWYITRRDPECLLHTVS